MSLDSVSGRFSTVLYLDVSRSKQMLATEHALLSQTWQTSVSHVHPPLLGIMYLGGIPLRTLIIYVLLLNTIQNISHTARPYRESGGKYQHTTKMVLITIKTL